MVDKALSMVFLNLRTQGNVSNTINYMYIWYLDRIIILIIIMIMLRDPYPIRLFLYV